MVLSELKAMGQVSGILFDYTDHFKDQLQSHDQKSFEYS
jgi:hypothetical protein